MYSPDQGGPELAQELSCRHGTPPIYQKWPCRRATCSASSTSRMASCPARCTSGPRTWAWGCRSTSRPALLTRMVAQSTGLKAGDFVHVIGDAHVYLNHVDALRSSSNGRRGPSLADDHPEKKQSTISTTTTSRSTTLFLLPEDPDGDGRLGSRACKAHGLLLTAQGVVGVSRDGQHIGAGRRRRRRRGGIVPLSAAGRATAGSSSRMPATRFIVSSGSRCTRTRRSPARRAAPGTCAVCAVSPATLCTRKTSSARRLAGGRRRGRIDARAKPAATAFRRRHYNVSSAPPRTTRPAMGTRKTAHSAVAAGCARSPASAMMGRQRCATRSGRGGRHFRKGCVPTVQYSRQVGPKSQARASVLFC